MSLFVHLGDTFYFYDHVTDELPRNVESMHAAHISNRRHIEFLDMAKVVPSCGIWDDHDFAGDNTDSTSLNDELRMKAARTWLQVLGKLTSHAKKNWRNRTKHQISHGLIDIYLLDDRLKRDKDEGVRFGIDIITRVLDTIDIHGAVDPRVVVLDTSIS